MAEYRLHLRHADTETVDVLPRLDELAERVALEQLMHELNPVDPAGYVVTFAAIASDGCAAATGHFYVRAARAVAPTTGTSSNSS